MSPFSSAVPAASVSTLAALTAPPKVVLPLELIVIAPSALFAVVPSDATVALPVPVLIVSARALLLPAV